MQRRQRLRKRRDFGRVYASGSRYRNSLLTVRVQPNELPVTRFGFVVGKAFGGAVERNQMKRRLRDIAGRTNVRPGVDVVIGVHRPAAASGYVELRQALVALFGRADLLVAAGDGGAT